MMFSEGVKNDDTLASISFWDLLKEVRIFPLLLIKVPHQRLHRLHPTSHPPMSGNVRKGQELSGEIRIMKINHFAMIF